MGTTFENQLNSKEIRQGLTIYIVHHLCPLIVLVSLGIGLFMLRKADLSTTAAGTIFVVVFALLLTYITLRRQFSTKRSSLYRFYDTHLEIDSKGCHYRYPWHQISVIETEKTIVLRLSVRSFSILAKQKLSPAQQDYLRKLSKKKKGPL